MAENLSGLDVINISCKKASISKCRLTSDSLYYRLLILGQICFSNLKFNVIWFVSTRSVNVFCFLISRCYVQFAYVLIAA